MNMCFGTKNSEKYSDEKAKCLVNEASSIETNIDRKLKFFHAKSSNKVSEEKKRPVEDTNSEPNNDRKTRNNSEENSNKSVRKETMKRIEIDGSYDASSNSEYNIVRKTKDISGKNSKKYLQEEKKKLIETPKSAVETSSGEAKFDRKMNNVSDKISNKIPREAKKKCLETERFVGDGLTLRMDSNERDIEVTGDGCRLTMTTNCGRIRMIGDGCRLQISRNSGDIEYTGDGGRVSLGPDSTGTKVHYVGEGGRVHIAESPIRGSFRNSTTSACGTSAARKKIEQKSPEDSKQCSEEVIDNILNERRAKQLLKTTCKTVRIVNGNTKILSPGRTKNSVQMDKSCTVYS